MADKEVVRGPVIQDCDMILICDDCEIFKSYRLSIIEEFSSERANDMLDTVQCDVCGPIVVPSLAGLRYCAMFIDEHFSW